MVPDEARVIDLEEWRYQLDRPRWNMEPRDAVKWEVRRLEAEELLAEDSCRPKGAVIPLNTA